MKKNKKLIGILSVVGIVLVVIATIVVFAVKDLKQETKLKEKFNEISVLVSKDEIDYEEVNKKLNTVVTSGDYRKVEEATKSYFSDILKEIKNITDILEDETLTNILTTTNYKSDGTNFTKSKKYITTTRDNLIDSTKKYNELLTEDKIMSYINNKGLDSYYTDLYKNELIGIIDKESSSIDEAINDIIEILNVYDEVLEFLKKNKNSWTVDNDKIVFNTNSQVNEYNQLLSKIG